MSAINPVAKVGGVDCSDILISSEIAYGKNQPFMMVRASFVRMHFNDPNYWESKETTRPVITPGETTLFLDTYGTADGLVIYQTKETEGEITVHATLPSIRLKYASLGSLARFINTSTTAPPTFRFEYAQNLILPAPTQITSEAEYYGRWLQTYAGLTFQIRWEPATNDTNEVLNIEQIYGPADALFKFISDVGGGFDILGSATPKVKVSPPYKYNTDPFESITTAEAVAIKSGSKVVTPEPIIRFRPDILCWDALKRIGELTCRTPFFCDKAYLVAYENPSDVTTYIPTRKIEYGEGDDYTEKVLGISVNSDQGQNYVLSTQTVTAENYTFTASISDVPVVEIGPKIHTAYPDTKNNTTRNEQVQRIAVNQLLDNFRPSDCITYAISEYQQESITPNYTVSSIWGLGELTLNPSVGDIAFLSQDKEYLVYTEKGGERFWDTFYPDGYRVASYTPDSMIGSLEDAQNLITIQNAPLAFTKLSYPGCLTELVWGNPEFQDSESRLSEIAQDASNAISDQGADINISDKFSAKLSIGNQSVAEIQDDWKGFSGIAIVKNTDSDVYELRGYSNGVVQSMMNSDGVIEGGSKGVQIGKNGLTLRTGALPITHTQFYNTSESIRFIARKGEGYAWQNIGHIVGYIPQFDQSVEYPLRKVIAMFVGDASHFRNDAAISLQAGQIELQAHKIQLGNRMQSGGNNISVPIEVPLGSLPAQYAIPLISFNGFAYKSSPGSTWYKEEQLRNGLGYSSPTHNLRTVVGVERLPSGTMIQTGYVTIPPSSSTTVNFHVPFAERYYTDENGTTYSELFGPIVSITHLHTDDNTCIAPHVRHVSNRSFTVRNNDGSDTIKLMWMAIGVWTQPFQKVNSFSGVP